MLGDALVEPIVISPEAVSPIGRPYQIREAAITNHSGVDRVAGCEGRVFFPEAQLLVQREPMLMPIEPDHRSAAWDDLVELFHGSQVRRTPIAEWLMMGEEYDASLVFGIVDPDDIGEPLDYCIRLRC